MSRRLLQLNGLAILAVILFHSAGWGFTAMFSWAHQYLPVASPDYSQRGSLAYYYLTTANQITVFAIPAFLSISGVFVAITSASQPIASIWRRIAGRLSKLIVPYLVWTGIVLVADVLQGGHIQPGRLIVVLLTGGANPAYYFIPLLIQFYLLAPFLVAIARRSRKTLLFSTLVLQLSMYALHALILLQVDWTWVAVLTRLLPKWLFIVNLFWFCLGIIVGFNLARVSEFCSKHLRSFVVVSVGLVVAGVVGWELLLAVVGVSFLPHWETLIDGVYSLCVMALVMALPAHRWVLPDQVASIGVKSFGIYLMHAPLMEYTSRLIYHFAPWILGKEILYQPILILTGLGVPLVAMAVVRRSPVRRLYPYLFG